MPTQPSVNKILTLLQSLEKTLVCPFGVEEDPVQDLCPLLPCGHLSSRRSWKLYEEKNPGRTLTCPKCKREVETLGSVLQMGDVCDIVKNIKDECRWLENYLEWNQAVRQPFPPTTSNNNAKGKGVSRQTGCLISMTHIPTTKQAIVTSRTSRQTVPVPAQHRQTVPINNFEVHVQSGLGGTSSRPTGSISSLTTMYDISEDFNPWAIDAPDPESVFVPVSTSPKVNATGHKRRPEMTKVPTFDSAYYTASPTESQEDLTLEDELDHYNGRDDTFDDEVENHRFHPPTRSESPLTVVAIPRKGAPSITSRISWEKEHDNAPPEPSFRSHYNRSPSPIITEPDFQENTEDLSDTMFPNVMTEKRLPESSKSLEKGKPPILDLTKPEHAHTVQVVTTAFPDPVQSSSTNLVSPQNSSPIRKPVRSRTTAAIIQSFAGFHVETPYTPPPTPGTIAYVDSNDTSSLISSHRSRQGSISTIGHKDSIPPTPSKSLMTPHADNTSLSSNGEQNPPQVRGFRVKTVTMNQVGINANYQATAISATCQTIALITREDFLIFSVKGVPIHICCGMPDGRYGKTRGTVKFDHEALEKRRGMVIYSRAVMSDDVLCIACEESCVDVHDTKTGRRLGVIEFPNRKCSSLRMAPNGQVLSIGMETGEVLLYNAVTGNFLVDPVIVKNSTASVTCIAFNPNSQFMSIGTSENKIYTYNVDTEPTLLSTYDRCLDKKSCKPPFFGITGLTLYHTRQIPI